ncbi:MAG: Fe(3+) dicitrate transport protein [Bradymonadia bacterium]|jgi:Fe(3+) dicitrate transport protein
MHLNRSFGLVLLLAAAPALADPAADPPSAEPVAPASADDDDDDDDDDIEGVRIVGTADRVSRLGGSAQVVGQQELEAYEYDDVHRALDGVSGVYVRDEDGFGLRPNIGMRGTSAERSSKITLMEDGVLIAPAPYAAPPAYYFPLTTRMVGVEVIKGPGSVEYGPNTVGGAINFVTRSIPRGAKGEVDLSTGRFGTDKAHAWAGWGDDRFGILLEWAQLDSDGFKELDDGGPTGFDKREAMGKLRWQTDPNGEMFHRLELKFTWSTERSDETYLGLSQADFDATPFRRYAGSQLDKMQWARTAAQLAYTFEAGANFRLRTVIYRTDFARDWLKLNRIQGRPQLPDTLRDPAGLGAVDVAVLAGQEDSAPRNPLRIGNNGRAYVSQGVDLSTRYHLKSEHAEQTLKAGVRVHQDEVRRDHDEASFDMVGGQLRRAGPDEFTTRNTEQALAVSGHLIDEVQIGEHLIVTPGARVEYILTDFEDRRTGAARNNSSVAVLPGLGAVYKFDPSWSVLTGVHRGFTPVSPRSGDFAQPESSINFEYGGRYMAKATRAEVIGFYNIYDNLLVSCTQSAGCLPEDIGRQFNGGALDVYGAEVLLAQALRVASGVRAQLDFSYTLTISEIDNAFVDPVLGEAEPGDALPYLPVHRARLAVGLWMGPVSVNTALRYVGEMRDVAGQGAIPAVEQVPDRLVLDVAAQWQVWDNLRAYARVDNATNRTYIASRRPYGLRPGKPIAFTLGVKYAISE